MNPNPFAEDRSVSTYLKYLPMDSPLMKCVHDYMETYECNIPKDKPDLKCSLLDVLSVVTTFISESACEDDFGSITDTLCRENICNALEHRVRTAKDSTCDTIVWKVMERLHPEPFDDDEQMEQLFDKIKVKLNGLLTDLISKDHNRITYTNARLYSEELVKQVVGM